MTERFCPYNLSDSFQYPFLRFAHSIDSLKFIISPDWVSGMVEYLRQVHLPSTYFRWTPVTTILVACAIWEINCLEWNVNFGGIKICHWSFFEGFVWHILEILVEKARITCSPSFWTVGILERTKWVICAKKCWFAQIMAISCARDYSKDTLLCRSVGFIFIKLWKDSLLIYYKALHGG